MAGHSPGVSESIGPCLELLRHDWAHRPPLVRGGLGERHGALVTLVLVCLTLLRVELVVVLAAVRHVLESETLISRAGLIGGVDALLWGGLPTCEEKSCAWKPELKWSSPLLLDSSWK